MIEITISYITFPSHSVRDNGSKQRYAGYIRQYVALTGLGLEEFNQVLMGLARAHKYFEDFLPPNKLEPLEPFAINGNLALACHTRYLTARRFCRSAIAQPFGPGVDPNGDLARIAGTSHIHTEDNVVQYLGIKHDSKQDIKYVYPSASSIKNNNNLTSIFVRYININPVRFQNGDIVEVTLSFFCHQTRSEKFKMMISLKTMTLLDDKIREV
jgi:hypothetical protein